MKNKETINWNILARHLAGETDERSQEYISEWLQESESNSVLYKEINEYWNHVNSMKEMNQFDVNNGWERLHKKIIASSGIAGTVKQRKWNKWDSIFSKPLLRIAAAITLLIMLGAGSYWMVTLWQKNSMITLATSVADDQTGVTLPDGTLVFLNADTKIRYSKNFNARGRKVKLTGEAYFDVARNPEKPFLIYSGKAGIKVLGTSFNVQALQSSGRVEVFVESGSVQLFEAENIGNTITIEPGYIGSMENETVEKQKNTDENYMAWKTKRLTFNNTDLAKVAKGIQDVFRVKVVFENPAMTQCKIKGNFIDEPLENVLEAICTIHNWNWERKGDKVILSGPGC